MRRKELTTAVPEPGNGAIQVEVTLPVRQRRRDAGEVGQVSKLVGQPQIPRITRLMALAIKFQDMVDRGEVRDYADLARLGYVTRARLTQIMNLLLLDPKIQEWILYAKQPAEWRFTERDIRAVVTKAHWQDQRVVLTGCGSITRRAAAGWKG
jgi:hypothetical protein